MRKCRVLEPSKIDVLAIPRQALRNRLMSIVRRDGHNEFGVYIFKLRDRTPGTDSQFDLALDLLKERCVVRQEGPMILMTSDGESAMYHPRLVGQAKYDPNDVYWEPLVTELDKILSG